MRLLKAGFFPLFEKKFFQSSWVLTEKCNLNCSYCVNKESRDGESILPKKLMVKGLDYLAALKRRNYNFSLSGGEVTLYPHLEEMLSLINSKFSDSECNIRLLSNGSCSLKKMRNIFALTKGHNSMFIISLHLEEINVASLLEKIKHFSEQVRKKNFLFKIIISPQNMECALKVINTFEEENLNYRIMPACDFDGGIIDIGFTKEQKAIIFSLSEKQQQKIYFKLNHLYKGSESTEYLKEIAFIEGIKEGMFNYRGMYCCAGHNSIYIDAKGNISKTEFCGNMGYNISDKNPFDDSDFFEPKKCVEAHCTCLTNTRLPKWSSSAYAPDFVKNI